MLLLVIAVLLLTLFVIKTKRTVTKTHLKRPLWVGLHNPSLSDVVALIECADKLLYISIAVALDSDADEFLTKLDKVVRNGSEFVSVHNTDNIDTLWRVTNQQETRLLVLPRNIRPSRGWDSQIANLNQEQPSVGKQDTSLTFWYGTRAQWKRAPNITTWMKRTTQAPLRHSSPIFTKNYNRSKRQT